MKKSWGLTQKILDGEKTIESRWYKNKHAPWDKIKPGDTIWFKDSGCPVSLKARITKILQFSDLDQNKIKDILKQYYLKISGKKYNHQTPLNEYYHHKKYCILIFFNQVQTIKPFNIDKTGFGSQAAWITINNINKIKK